MACKNSLQKKHKVMYSGFSYSCFNNNYRSSVDNDNKTAITSNKKQDKSKCYDTHDLLDSANADYFLTISSSHSNIQDINNPI